MCKGKRRNRPHLYIMRGLPGSGKSRIARTILEKYSTGGVILSTDDYFRDENGKMHFNRRKLPEAHRWNRSRDRYSPPASLLDDVMVKSPAVGAPPTSSWAVPRLAPVASGKLMDGGIGELHFSFTPSASWELKNQRNPVIIDNTNIHCWEMKSYVEMGLRFRYHIRFREAWDTWECSTEELSRRIRGVVPLDVMERMKREYEDVYDIYDVLNS